MVNLSDYRVNVGVEESTETIVNAIKEFGPFDGVASFSQGSAIFRAFMFYTHVINPEPYKYLQFPKFVISFGGGVFKDILLKLDGKYYSTASDFKCRIDSMHIYGTKDVFFDKCEMEPSLYLPG